MKKYTRVLIAVIVLAIGGYAVLEKKTITTPSEKPVITIGLIAPLTGNLSFLGEAAKNGANLALDEVNANSNNRFIYRLAVEDDALDPKKSVSAAIKLITLDKVDAIIGLSTSAGNAVNPITEKYKVPYICMASDANVAKGDYNFIHWTQPQEEVTLMLEELAKKNIKKVALITQNQGGWLAISNDLKARAPALGITVVDGQLFNAGDKDFRTAIGHIKKQNPEIYIIGAFSPELELIGRQIKEQGILTPMTSIESFGLSNDPSIFEGMWFVDSAVATSGTFRDKYIKKHKEVVPAAPNAYDAIHLLVLATEKGASGAKPTGTDIAKNLLQTSGYVGALGKLSVTQDGIFTSNASVKKVVGGKAVAE